MTSTANPRIFRRRFLQTAGATALAASGPAFIIPGRAQPKTLKILDFGGFDPPGYDEWLHRYAQEWGERNNTQVILHRLKFFDLDSRITSEMAEEHGHDLVNFSVSTNYEEAVINVADVLQECERRYGQPVGLSADLAYNPDNGKVNEFLLNYFPVPVIYRQDLWDAVGRYPDSWENVRLGGRHIKLVHGPAVGLSLGSDPDAWRNVLSILYSFGGAVQDADNRPVLKSKETLEALKFFQALYVEAMSEEMLSWDSASNNRALVAGEISLTLNSVNALRTAENLHLPIAAQLALAKPPQGPAQQLSVAGSSYVMGIWRFAENIDGAKQFLVDFVGASRQLLLASQFYHFPAYPQTIPDLAQLLADDAQSQPPGKYRLLAGAADWSVLPAYPGIWNRAFAEVWDSGLVQKMFTRTVSDRMTPEEALTQADQELRTIYQKWQDAGKI